MHPTTQLEEGWQHEGETQAAGPVDEQYLMVFLLKYVCPEEGCGGTLAPSSRSSDHECNVCGRWRSEAQFLQQLQDEG